MSQAVLYGRRPDGSGMPDPILTDGNGRLATSGVASTSGSIASQGSNTAGQNGSLTLHATRTAAPALVNGQNNAGTVDALGNLQTTQGFLPAGTDRSGNVAIVSNIFVAANPNRRGLELQNIGANNVGINEFGGAAVLGTAGTYTLAPGATMSIRTNRAIFAIASTAPVAVTATEW